MATPDMHALLGFEQVAIDISADHDLECVLITVDSPGVQVRYALARVDALDTALRICSAAAELVGEELGS